MNKRLRPQRGAGKRRREGDPFGDLRRHIDDLRFGKTQEDRVSQRNALARFVGGLSADERTHLRRDWTNSPHSTQTALHTAICSELGGIGGPAETLLRELRDDTNRQIDGLPDPPAVSSERSSEEWEAILVGNGLSAEKAREMAAELTKPLSEKLKDFWIAHGSSPEAAEEMVAIDLRNQKWAAVSNATLPAVVASRERAERDELRPIAGESARLAKSIAQETIQLASCLDRIRVGQRRGSEAGRAALAAFRSTVTAGGNLADILASLSQVAEALATEMAALDEELSRPVGGQPKDLARAAAAKLKAGGLTYKQITDVLVRRGLVPDWYTQEHTRDLFRKKPGGGKATPPREG